MRFYINSKRIDAAVFKHQWPSDGDLKSKDIDMDLKKQSCAITDMQYRIIWVRKLGAEEVR